MAWFSGIKHRWNRAKVFLTERCVIFLPQVFLSFSPSLFSSLSLTWLTSMDTPLAAHLLCRCLPQPYSLFLLLSFLAFSKPLSRQTSPAKMLPSSLCFISQISSPSLFSPKPPLVFLFLKTPPSLPKQLTLSVFSFWPLPSRKSSLCQKQPPTNLLHVSLA